MKKILIPIVILLLVGCGKSSPSVHVIDASPFKSAPSEPIPVELKYKVGDKVLLRLGMEGIVTKIRTWGDARHFVRILLVNVEGGVVLSEVLLHEFEIEKKIE